MSTQIDVPSGQSQRDANLREINLIEWIRSSVAVTVVAATLLSLAVVIAVLVWISVTVQTNLILQSEQEQLATLHDQFQSQIEARETLALALATYVANDPRIQEAFAEAFDRGERLELINLVLPSYQALDAAVGVPQYQFHLPPAISFLRINQLDRWGDDLSAFRFTVLDANNNQVPVVGPEVGKEGMGIRGVVPISYKGEHRGTVEFGVDMGEEFLIGLAEQYSVESALFFDTSAAKTTMFVQEGKVATKEDFILFASSGRVIPVGEAIYQQVVQSGQPQIAHTTYEGVPYAVYVAPLTDYSGDTLGVTTIYLDRSQLLAQIAQNRWASIRAGVLLALISGALIWFLVNWLVGRPVREIMGVYERIGMGDFAARSTLTSRNELGRMALSLNTVLDNTLSLIQTREERDAMQASVVKLLGEVSGVAEGDLTAEAEVTADMTGAIADAFNYMIGQLREIVSGVQDATLQVSSSANEIQTTAEHLAQGSEAQAMQIADTSSAVEEMAVSIQQVSENAALSATVGEQALVNARQGARAVQETIEEMNRIREQVQETARRIERLGESSQEIGEIVRLIGDIADRTSVLALNASIQAARAGKAGRGFAVVAEEVERLAERSTEATKQIDALIKTIQSETSEAVAAMEATTQEVVAGSELADQAGQALAEIEGVSNRLAELIQSISLASKQQARGSEALSSSMDEIAEVTQQTAAGTKQAAVSISTLTILADELRASVSAFKLPGSNGRGN
jgi:methyl-accepting chemotaxis protein